MLNEPRLENRLSPERSSSAASWKGEWEPRRQEPTQRRNSESAGRIGDSQGGSPFSPARGSSFHAHRVPLQAGRRFDIESAAPHWQAAKVSHVDRAREVFESELEGIKAVQNQLDGAFDAAVELAVETIRHKGKIVVVGIGKSGNLGHKIAATLTSTGAPAVVMNSVDAMHGDLGLLNDGDLILALSYTGETDELLHFLPALKRFSVRIVSVTGAPQSTLARYSDVVLNAKVPREACPFNLAPTASTTAMLVLCDAFAMAILEARGFRPQDFAKRHPSGAIGRALLLRVREIMRTGDRNAVISANATVKEALLVMTRAKSGSVSVIDAQGCLAGVFTDGDLRRRMASDENVLSRPLKNVMTLRPIVIHEDALAMEAVKVFDERNIDDLIVVNARQEPVGLIDSQDLPKMKLM